MKMKRSFLLTSGRLHIHAYSSLFPSLVPLGLWLAWRSSTLSSSWGLDENVKTVQTCEKIINVCLCCSQNLRNGEVQLLKSHNQLTLCVKAGSDLEFSMFECSAAKKKVEMKALLFSLWDNLQSTRTKLTSKDST